jgi:hypothetical protein
MFLFLYDEGIREEEAKKGGIKVVIFEFIREGDEQ